MTVVARSALVPYSPDEMFRLVADIEEYPAFLPWCRSATVHESRGDNLTASLEVSKGPLRKSFTTRNTLHDGERIELELVDGPFERLRGCWRFLPHAGAGCRVALDLEFELARGVLRRVLNPVFNEIADSMVDAFCRRARDVYGVR